MELKEKLEFCRQCINREQNSNGILLCGLTHSIPSFESECKDFKRDENEPDNYLDDSAGLSFGEIKEKLEPEIYQKFQKDQRFMFSIYFGFFACIVGAIIWALIAYLTNRQFGFIAILIGAIVGLTVKKIGKGFELKFAIIGAIFSLLGCIIGKLIIIIAFSAIMNNISFLDVLFVLDFSKLFLALKENSSFFDLIFYGIAIYEGFRFSYIRYTEKELWQISTKYK